MSSSNFRAFFYGADIVGHFLGSPSSDSWHTYEPCRCIGHANFSGELRQSGVAQVWMELGDGPVEFIIDEESFDMERANGRWQIHISSVVDGSGQVLNPSGGKRAENGPGESVVGSDE